MNDTDRLARTIFGDDVVDTGNALYKAELALNAIAHMNPAQISAEEAFALAVAVAKETLEKTPGLILFEN